MNKKRSEIIAFSLVLIMIELASASYSPVYYRLNMNYENNKLDIKSINIEISQDNLNNVGDNLLEIVDFNGNLIENNNFFIPKKIAYDYGDKDGKISNGKIVELENVSFELYVPYHENAREIRFYDENKTSIGRVDVSMFAKDYTNSGKSPSNQICINGKCKDNKEDCEFDYDCPINNSYKNIVGGDKDEHGCIGSAGYSWCEEKQKCLRTWEEKCENESSSSNSVNIINKISENRNLIILVLIAVVLIVLVVVLFMVRKR